MTAREIRERMAAIVRYAEYAEAGHIPNHKALVAAKGHAQKVLDFFTEYPQPVESPVDDNVSS